MSVILLKEYGKRRVSYIVHEEHRGQKQTAVLSELKFFIVLMFQFN